MRYLRFVHGTLGSPPVLTASSINGAPTMSVRRPTKNPNDRNACRNALHDSFHAIIRDADWSGWGVEAIAHALSDLSKEHMESVEHYRDRGRLPASHPTDASRRD